MFRAFLFVKIVDKSNTIRWKNFPYSCRFMKRSKRTYDTCLIYLAIYDEEAKKQLLQIIPSSTYYGWREKGGEHFFGKEFSSLHHANAIQVAKLLARSQRLIQLAKGLFHIYSAYKTVIASLSNFKEVCKRHKVLLVKTFHAATQYLSKSKVYKALGVSHDFIHYKAIVSCSSSIMKKCLKRYSNQLSQKDTNIIREYINHPLNKNWQGISIYWQMLRDKKVCFSKTTFYRYLHKMGVVLEKKKRVWKNYNTLKASRPFEILHMDVTYVVLNNVKAYLYLIIDNFSRSILGYQFSTKIKSSISTQNLVNVCREYNIHIGDEVMLVTDGGSENKGYVNRFVNLSCINIVKKVAQTDIASSNSMVESIIKQLKQFHIFLSPDDDLVKVQSAIDVGIKDYQNKPLDVHKGYTPAEVMNFGNQKLELKSFFTQAEKKMMLKERKENNSRVICGKC